MGLKLFKRLLPCLSSALVATALCGCPDSPYDPPAFPWSRPLPGASIEMRDIRETMDSGFVVTGFALGDNSDQAYFAKLGAGGNLVWNRTYPELGHAHAVDALPTIDGNYTIAGSVANSETELNDFLLVRLNSEGGIEWSGTYNIDGQGSGVPPAMCYANSLCRAWDGGYVLAGYLQRDGEMTAMVVKTDISGNLAWARSYGIETVDECFTAICSSLDGNYVAVGYRRESASGRQAVLVVKFDENGDVVWTQSHHLDYMAHSSFDRANTVERINEGGFIVAGESISSGITEGLIMVLSDSGNVQWAYAYNGADMVSINGIAKWQPDQYVAVGYSLMPNSQRIDAVMGITLSGSVMWTWRDYDESKRYEDYATSVCASSDGGLVFTSCDVEKSGLHHSSATKLHY